MTKAILYVHGKGGSYKEAELYKNNCIGYDTHGVDYEVDFPWVVENKIKAEYDMLQNKYDEIYIIANSIGAYFVMNTLSNSKIAKALFISPIVNMEKLILYMMIWANVTEQNYIGTGKSRRNLARHCRGNIYHMLEPIQSRGVFPHTFYMPRMII